MRNKNHLLSPDRDWKAWSVVLAATSALMLSACSSDESSQEARSGDATVTRDELVFDDLGGGPGIIQVYPGVTEAAADKQFSGTFNDGDTVTALCKTAGRNVDSVPTLGETERSSNEWVSIIGSPGVTQYATVVYIENPDALLAQLEDCGE